MAHRLEGPHYAAASAGSSAGRRGMQGEIARARPRFWNGSCDRRPQLRRPASSCASPMAPAMLSAITGFQPRLLPTRRRKQVLGMAVALRAACATRARGPHCAPRSAGSAARPGRNRGGAARRPRIASRPGCRERPARGRTAPSGRPRQAHPEGKGQGLRTGRSGSWHGASNDTSPRAIGQIVENFQSLDLCRLPPDAVLTFS